jgi:CheY-like chemotaxis protein
METLESRRALVIDDETMVRTMLADALEVFGYSVDAVDSGKAALARFAAGRYDVVMTDLLMPDMSGLEVVEELRRIDPSVPMILLTGAGGGSVATDARVEGVLMIYKPVSLMKLKAALETRCQRAVGA